jgi:hypothetical protein
LGYQCELCGSWGFVKGLVLVDVKKPGCYEHAAAFEMEEVVSRLLTLLQTRVFTVTYHGRCERSEHRLRAKFGTEEAAFV